MRWKQENGEMYFKVNLTIDNDLQQNDTEEKERDREYEVI